MFKILFSFGYWTLDYLYITLVVVSLLLLALAQSYASAKKMKFVPALVLSLGILIVGNLITYFLFDALFSEYRTPQDPQHIAIYSYGFMLMLAFVVGTIWLIMEGRKQKPIVEADTVLDLMVFIIIGSIIGARGIYVATQAGDYAGESARNILRITEGGLSIHGGIIGALIFGFIYSRIKGLDYWKLVDMVVPAVALGQFFGRIGCFLNGCCYGIKCYTVDANADSPLRNLLVFPNTDTWISRHYTPEIARFYDAGQAALGQYARHPTQIYEAVGALAIFWYLLSFRKNKAFTGHVFLMYVWCYSLLRFLVENFRFGNPDQLPENYDKIGSSIVLFDFITLAQLASIILGIIALFLMQDLKRRSLLAKMLKDGKGKPETKPDSDSIETETDVIEDEQFVEEEFVEEEAEADDLADLNADVNDDPESADPV